MRRQVLSERMATSGGMEDLFFRIGKKKEKKKKIRYPERKSRGRADIKHGKSVVMSICIFAEDFRLYADCMHEQIFCKHGIVWRKITVVVIV